MHKSTYLENTLLFLFSLLLLQSCVGVKPSTTKSGKHLFETFFVGEQGTQYFIKPMNFENKQAGLLKLDLTFRYKDKIKDSTTINFSLLGKEIIKNIDSLIISNSKTKITSKKVKLLFNEKTKQGFKSRFSTKIPLTALNELFTTNKWIITTCKSGNYTKYLATEKTKKGLKKLNETVFILF